MKVCFSKIIHWIFSLGILINLDGTIAQVETTLQDLITLCNEQRILECEWLENYKQQNAINEILQQFADSNKNYLQYRPARNHISPRYATYDSPKDSVPQYPFTSGWKGQLTKILNPDKPRTRKPFSYDNNKRTPPHLFSSWGGKRTSLEEMANKREPAFSSWGGKRTQKFFNWGGKRSIPESELNDVVLENSNEHNIMKRSTKSEKDSEKDRPKRATDKKLCITDEINLQELFKEFIEWSRRQPEQKKGSFYRKMFTVSTLHSPDDNMSSRRAGSFFQWGGKRSTK